MTSPKITCKFCKVIGSVRSQNVQKNEKSKFEWSQVLRVTSPKISYKLCKIIGMVTSPQGRKSEWSQMRKVTSPNGHKSEVFLLSSRCLNEWKLWLSGLEKKLMALLITGCATVRVGEKVGWLTADPHLSDEETKSRIIREMVRMLTLLHAAHFCPSTSN